MGCVGNVRATLSKISGVQKVSVNLDKKMATVTLKEKASLSKEKVVAVLKNTKFKVTSFEKK
jgi:copper chaperone CopZ